MKKAGWMSDKIIDKIKVLIVDDSSFDRNLFSSVLEKKGFQVVCAESGAQCFEVLQTYMPDIILLDYMMPETSGKDVMLKLRKKYNTVELPVIMVTAKSDTSDIVELLSIGANDYVTKPVDFEVALMRIMTHIKIGSLSREMARLKEMEAVSAMIATYNHEINNGITIALGHLKIYTKANPQETLEKLENTLWKIVDVVKKIEAVTTQETVEYSGYAAKTQMLKLK